MHKIEPARLKPGLRADQVGEPAGPRPVRAGRGLIRGRALIFWDPKQPPGTKKLDAIDTDQITPAADCVSESLDNARREVEGRVVPYLMPDFRRACTPARTSSSPAIGSPSGLRAK
jgi:hypothetical protein